MNYRVIDYESWPRREKYEFFCAADQPFYNLGYRLDVTNAYGFAKKNGVSFYMVLTYLVTKAINSVEAFRCARLDGQVVLFDELMPSFTDLKPGSDSFHIVTMPAGDDILAFCRRQSAAVWRRTASSTRAWRGRTSFTSPVCRGSISPPCRTSANLTPTTRSRALPGAGSWTTAAAAKSSA